MLNNINFRLCPVYSTNHACYLYIFRVIAMANREDPLKFKTLIEPTKRTVLHERRLLF